MQRNEWIFLGAGMLSAVAVFVTGLGFKREYTPPAPSVIRVPVPDHLLAREIPLKFPARSCKPALTEGKASGSIGLSLASIERDLVRVEDPRVYWESDVINNGPEDDHLMHRAIVDPFRRLAHQVAARGGTLEVHDAYRPDGGEHSQNSLHKEGRALDLTCDQMTMEELAALCWAAGFDWVLHEHPKNGGVHVHCSVRHDKEPLTFEIVANPQ